MAKYINADVLKSYYSWWGNSTEEAKENKAVFDQIIDLQPTADVVPKEDVINELIKKISDRVIQALEENYEIIPKTPVVRCKYCKHFVRSEGVCKVLSNNYEPPVYVKDDDFCSRGERREDE